MSTPPPFPKLNPAGLPAPDALAAQVMHEAKRCALPVAWADTSEQPQAVSLRIPAKFSALWNAPQPTQLCGYGINE